MLLVILTGRYPVLMDKLFKIIYMDVVGTGTGTAFCGRYFISPLVTGLV